MDYLTGAQRNKEEGWQSILNDFNSSNIRGGYKIIPRNSGGWQLLNPDGEEIPLPLRKQKSNPH